MIPHLRPALVLLLVFTAATGIMYPLAVTGIAQLLFPSQANGELIVSDGKIVGSALIGQQFNAPGYFWGRLSATSPAPYNAAASSGSNLGPLNPALLDAVKSRLDALRGADSTAKGPVPADLVTASASGLDPHISLAAALYQVPRVARERHVSEASIRAMIAPETEYRQFGFLGEDGVNVLKLNLALDETHPIPIGVK